MKNIMIFPRGKLSPKDKERMSKLGVCAIEADDPSKVVSVVPRIAVTADMLAMSALHAMSGSGYVNVSDVRSCFAAELTRRLKEREASNFPP